MRNSCSHLGGRSFGLSDMDSYFDPAQYTHAPSFGLAAGIAPAEVLPSAKPRHASASVKKSAASASWDS